MNPLKQIICAGMVAALMPAFAAETPNSAEQLLDRLQSAIKAKDTNALVALVNCQGISDRMKSLILPMMADMPNHEIASMKLLPLPEKYQSTYEVNGIRYRPNVPPVGLIDVQFVKSENAVQSMQVPYGKSRDGFWIPGTLEEKITGAGSTEALARAKLEKAKAAFQAQPESVSQKDEYGRTPLNQAVCKGDKDIVELLLTYNVDINAGDNSGRTALHWAADTGQVEVMKLLLAKKASVDAKSNAGWTPLHEAAYMGKTEAAALLLANQAEVNAKANNGQTSLHLAALHGYTEMVALLIANKAEINVQDDKKQTPLGAALDTNSLPKYLLPTALPGKKSAADLLRQAETGSAPK
jgi:hypothetical protein